MYYIVIFSEINVYIKTIVDCYELFGIQSFERKATSITIKSWSRFFSLTTVKSYHSY